MFRATLGVVRVAGFREKPNAQAAALILKNHGYDADTIGIDDDGPFRWPGEPPETVRTAYWANAFVLSNCESEYFREVVIDNFGTIIWTGRRRR